MIGCRWIHAFAVLCVLVSARLPFAAGQEGVAEETDTLPEEPVLKPTEIGVRFTPEIAQAMSRRFLREMKPRYELDDEQAGRVEEVMTRQLMKFAHENAALGRDMFELMMATMIENDGRFPRDAAVKFASHARPLVANLKKFFTESSAEISRHMGIRQRLKFTGDVTAAAAGLTVFETRMNRWAEGKVGDNANPFWDPGDNDPRQQESEPVDPAEHEDHRQARKDVERWIDFQINLDENWESYLEKAVEFYKLTEQQTTAARAVLEDCRERARAVKTPQWRKAVVENRIARQLSRRSDDNLGRGPWMFALESDYKRMLKPLEDLDLEFKRRIEELPSSAQRAAARDAVRKALEARGVKNLPV